MIYRDFKASNVLLDENFKPKLSDFGLAREGPVAGDTHVSTAVSATPYSVAFAYFIGIFYWLISGNFIFHYFTSNMIVHFNPSSPTYLFFIIIY